MIEQTFVGKTFSEVAVTWDTKNKSIRRIKGESERLRKILNDYVTPNAKVLDIGTGTGKLVNTVCKCNHDINVIAIDLSYDMLSLFREKFEKHSVTPVRMDACNLCFEDNVFDVVTMQQVIHHLPDVEKVFDQVYRVLKPNGKLAILLVGSGYQDNVFPWNGEDIQKDILGRMTSDNIAMLLRKHGFAINTLIRDFFKFEFENFKSYFNFMDSIGALNRPFGYKTEITACEKEKLLIEKCSPISWLDGALEINGEYITVIAEKIGEE